jgi:lycopene beta-cyclase
MSSREYDFGIIGAGAAGLHLILAMITDDYFKDKRILLVDKDKKDKDDKTWCFWEKNEGKWDAILAKSWEKGDFYYSDVQIPLELLPYRYKMLRSLDFYNYAKAEIQKHENIDLVFQEVLDLTEINNKVHIRTNDEVFIAEHVFDSSIDQSFSQEAKKHVSILQHFKGWYVKTKENYFDEGRFTMMDYRLQWKDKCSFTYVLPLNKKEALIEFTLFTPELIEQEEYDIILHEYISNILNISDFEIEQIEYGVIPMTTYPFRHHSTQRITKIGTAGGWVKASSGYSFKNAEKYALLTIDNIKSDSKIDKSIYKGRAKFMDAIFLNVLYQNNNIGPSIFYDMYSKNSIQKIFAFLDEENTFLEDLKIISSFKVFPFIKGMLRYLFKKI